MVSGGLRFEFLLACLIAYHPQATSASDGWKTAASIYDFDAVDIDGNKVSLSKYRGHVALIVNVATK
ncbi:hypothetical protein HPB47_026274 [Ixodes persulcatus]|uniref:Uncharacterized protein n=1 Tax=Ixodes persulcatus TaxID=34615 RepID=A0AC60PZ47_IXOPE|nr:hypothetical protein HPB47_026274 [Ixodes persulcatus]